MDTAHIDFSTMKVAAVLNTASGFFDANAEQKMRMILTNAHILEPLVVLGNSTNLEEVFSEITAFEPDVLIILGGDGTIRAAAEAFPNTFLVPLPGGTMNMLPHALYGEKGWEEVARNVLAAPAAISISGGSIQGKRFFIAAMVGAPVLWAKARESLRGGDIGGSIDQGVTAFQKMLGTKISYSFAGGGEGEAGALAVVCPLISDEMENTEASFEAAVIDVENVGEVLGLVSSAAFGTWRKDANVSIVKTKTITISGEEEIPIILDGETMHFGKNISIEFVPQAFKVVVPRV